MQAIILCLYLQTKTEKSTKIRVTMAKKEASEVHIGTWVLIERSGREGRVKNIVLLEDGMTLTVATATGLVAVHIDSVQILPNQVPVTTSTKTGSRVLYHDKYYTLLSTYVRKGQLVGIIQDRKGVILSSVAAEDMRLM